MNAHEPSGTSADGAIVPAPRSPSKPATGGAREGAGTTAGILNPTQREARKRDRAAIERARRPAIAHLIRRARLFERARYYLIEIAKDETNPLELRVGIWKELARLGADAQTEILDRTGVQKLKSVELRAFDDLARELEREQQPEKAPEVTAEMILEATRAVIAAGGGRVEAIDVPYEELVKNDGVSGPH